MNEEEFLNILKDLSSKINISLSNKQAKDFYKYMNLLLEWNQKMNLTAIVEPKEVILKHFIDSITINKYIDEESYTILDIGTGAGFPGIPLKILQPSKKMILADSLQKRINFLEKVTQELSFSNTNCIHGRAEELAKNKEFREQIDIVVSRAVARLNVLVEYMLPFVKLGGKCICMKGPQAQDELNESERAINILGGKIEKIEEIILPSSEIERTIIIIKKVKSTPKQYPRKSGMPSKQPII